MTELEKIEYAKTFIDKLAGGINPLDGTPIPEGDLVNHVRISGCFAYVSGILQRAIEGERTEEERNTKAFISPEQLADFEFFAEPIVGSVLLGRVNKWAKLPRKEIVSVAKMNRWLIQKGLLCEGISLTGKNEKLPTEQGRAIGICSEIRTGRDGEYIAILYDANAQRFIVDRIAEIQDFSKH